MDNMELDLEKRYLEMVLGIIDRQLTHLTDTEASEDVISARREMWGDTTHIIREFDDVTELSAHNMQVAIATESYLRTADRIKWLQRQRSSPYFGRFDFVENNENEREAIYIGAYNLIDKDSYKSYVCDWRAPICSVFYECDPGSTSYKTPDGDVDIQVVLKRQYKIENGSLIYLYDTNSHMHDDILGRVLSGNTTNRLKVIISSIQKEQNAAIRESACRLMLIYGPAGSGKTSVGLHRMAYLLYHLRNTLRACDIVFISSNEIFSSYISNIMPDLGEDEITRFVFSQLFSHLVKDGYRIESRFEQYEALDRDESSTGLRAVQMKYSLDFIDFLADYFKSYRLIVSELRYRDETIVSREALQSKWDSLSFSGYKSYLSNLCDYIRQAYDYYFHHNKQKILNDITRRHDEMMSEEAALCRYEALLERCINTAIEDVMQINEVDAKIQLLRALSLFCEEKGYSKSYVNNLKKSLEDKVLMYEDGLLLLFAGVCMGQVEPYIHVSHVLIDEAQDYNLLELSIIKALYPQSSFTLLADINQSVSKETSITGYEELELIFGGEIKKIHLGKSYRSSGPINALAFQLISKIDGRFRSENSYFERNGSTPRYIVTRDAAGTIAGIIGDLGQYNTIGIITSDTHQAIKLHEELSGVLEARLLVNPSDEITQGVTILPLILSKGLEFDVVFAVGCLSDSGSALSDRRRAYLACTRALHELFIIEAYPLPESYSDCRALVELYTDGDITQIPSEL